MHHIARLLALLATASIAQPTTAETDLGEHNGRFCGGAANATWDQIRRYADVEALVDIETAYANARCRLSEGNSDEYVGNLFHTTIRMNPNARDITSKLVRYLLKDQPTEENRALFVALIRGDDVDHDIFRQIQSTWADMPGRHDIAMFAMRAICMSIDRHDITELADVRANECNTPPFVEPWRLP